MLRRGRMALARFGDGRTGVVGNGFAMADARVAVVNCAGWLGACR